MQISTPDEIIKSATVDFPTAITCLMTHLNLKLIYDINSINSEVNDIKTADNSEIVTHIRFHR